MNARKEPRGQSVTTACPTTTGDRAASVSNRQHCGQPPCQGTEMGGGHGRGGSSNEEGISHEKGVSNVGGSPVKEGASHEGWHFQRGGDLQQGACLLPTPWWGVSLVIPPKSKAALKSAAPDLFLWHRDRSHSVRV